VEITRLSPRIGIVLVLVAALVTLASGRAAASGSWKHVAITRHQGSIDATLSYDTRTVRGYLATIESRHITLVVRLAGKVVIDAHLRDGIQGIQSELNLRLRNVWGGSEPEALVDVASCGNRCGVQLDVGLVGLGETGRVLFHDFNGGWPGPRAWRGQWHDGRFEFVSLDQRFFCSFSNCADSGVPVQVFALAHSGRRFVDVTRSRPDLIEANAAGFWTEYLRGRERTPVAQAEAMGLLAPWCADQFLLGRSTHCDQAIAQAVAHGYLRVPSTPVSSFLLSFRKTLAGWGYGRG
jgi:hypothetical protein